MPEGDVRQDSVEVVLASRQLIVPDVLTIAVVRPDGRAFPPWSPGSHIDVVIGDLVRQYSLCGDPADLASYRVAIKVDPAGRGGSTAAADLEVGCRLRVSAPRNHFELVPAPSYLFVAGGIGITPFLSMIREVDRRGVPWRLVYGGRERASMAFADSLRSGHPDRVELWSDDEEGPVDVLHTAGSARSDTAVYCCGPEPMMVAMESAMGERRDRLHLERFRPRERAVTTDHEFTVEVASTGQRLSVHAGESVLEVLRAAGVDVPFSCTEGTCGTCETPVLRGRVEHRDSILTPEEQASGEYMMVCVSRAADAELVIDR